MPAQSLRSIQEPNRRATAFLTALVMHSAVLALLVVWPPRDAARPPGEQEISVDLAPAIEEIASIAPAFVSAAMSEDAPPEAKTIDAQVPEEAMEDHPDEATASPEPVEASAPLDPQAASALPPPEEIAARPPEEKAARKAEMHAPLKIRERKPPPPQAVAEPRPASNPRQGQTSSSRENTGGAAASADPIVLNRYVASLAAALRNRLRYPELAKSRNIEGIATLRFAMDRSGRIISASIVRSAGHPALDEAALATASPGSLLPAAPGSLPQQQFTLTVPLRFNLR